MNRDWEFEKAIVQQVNKNNIQFCEIKARLNRVTIWINSDNYLTGKYYIDIVILASSFDTTLAKFNHSMQISNKYIQVSNPEIDYIQSAIDIISITKRIIFCKMRG